MSKIGLTESLDLRHDIRALRCLGSFQSDGMISLKAVNLIFLMTLSSLDPFAFFRISSSTFFSLLSILPLSWPIPSPSHSETAPSNSTAKKPRRHLRQKRSSMAGTRCFLTFCHLNTNGRMTSIKR